MANLNFNGLIHMRPYATDAQRQAILGRGEQQYGHLTPDSVLVVAMSNHWAEGCWAKVADMVMATNAAGMPCGLHELMDRCLNWGDAMGTMRNEGLMLAANEGFDWVCYVDNDVRPEPNLLVRLINRRQSVIAPYVVEPGAVPVKPLHGPPQRANTGLQPVRWAVLSMLLIRTRVFNCTGPAFWSDAIGADESVHFHRLWWYGHQLYVDTDAPLETTKPPTYPLSSNRLTYEERERFWAGRRESLQKAPDRRPLWSGAPCVFDGAYMPFLHGANGKAGATGPQGAINQAQPATLAITAEGAAPVVEGQPQAQPVIRPGGPSKWEDDKW